VSGGPTKSIVLVPGACLGGWCWRAVAAPLRAAGHDIYPLTLTGLGERAHLARPEVDLDTHIADVVGVLDYEDLRDAVLVGHSYAGIVITGVADRRPERVETLVYLDTSPVPNGTAIVDVQPPEQHEQQRQAVERDGEGWRWPVPDRETLMTGAFGSVSGLSDTDLRLISERATPQPYATFTSPLRLTGQPSHVLHRHVIFCSAGGTEVATVRELIAQRDPRAAVFADPDWELHELPTGHWAMLSAPRPLAQRLHEIATTLR
jgi:pimeloyl-ACP methyl ester carboxylesterase